MNRRGFLGALFAGAAVAADPDLLLWRPKLISIPAHMHVPHWHQFHVAFVFDSPECAQILSEVEARYLAPAAAALDAHIRRYVDDAGGAPARFHCMELPQGLDLAVQRPLGPLPNARILRFYDHYDGWRGRVDCSVTI